jgi:uncharacterized protein (TIGR00725 family)
VPASPRIAIYGSSTVTEDSRPYGDALELGAELARAGAVVMTGGYAGVMEAASRGAHEAGGHVIGVTLELFDLDPGRIPNRWIAERFHAPDLFERLRRMVQNADGFVAVTGSIGTITEVCLTWNLLMLGGRSSAPLVLLGEEWPAWLQAMRRAGAMSEELMEHVALADSPGEAARLALGRAGVAARSERP